MAMFFFCYVEFNRTDFTDLHGFFVKNAPAEGDVFFCYVEYHRTDFTDLHGLFVNKCARGGRCFFLLC